MHSLSKELGSHMAHSRNFPTVLEPDPRRPGCFYGSNSAILTTSWPIGVIIFHVQWLTARNAKQMKGWSDTCPGTNFWQSLGISMNAPTNSILSMYLSRTLRWDSDLSGRAIVSSVSICFERILGPSFGWDSCRLCRHTLGIGVTWIQIVFYCSVRA